MERPSTKTVLSLSVYLFAAVLVSFLLLGLPLFGQGLVVAAATGAFASLLWFLLPALSPGVVGFLAAFVPAAFIPEAYFIGYGVVFILSCTAAGAVFSLARRLLRQE